MTADRIRVLVVGCGNMGTSHARAYHRLDGVEVAGVVSRGPESRSRLAAELGGVPAYGDVEEALAATVPDAVSVNTWPATHAHFALAALRRGAHVFVEKPLGTTLKEAETVVCTAKECGCKVGVGYILHHHPSWVKFVELARTLGKPLVMRMNLNQQSRGSEWATHRNLMQSMSPVVDCGVHYVDIMCRMTGARPTHVHAMGARLTDEVYAGMYNYGQLQVRFDDGSCGWYEAGWGPMMSETAYFVKDVIGPRGAVSIVDPPAETGSADVGAHTRTNRLRHHHAALAADGAFERADDVIDLSDEPDHDELCYREQAWFIRAIREDLDLDEHLRDAVNSLRIVLAADRSVRTGEVVEL
jgi:predicted dehydrogenase